MTGVDDEVWGNWELLADKIWDDSKLKFNRLEFDWLELFWTNLAWSGGLKILSKSTFLWGFNLRVLWKWSNCLFISGEEWLIYDASFIDNLLLLLSRSMIYVFLSLSSFFDFMLW